MPTKVECPSRKNVHQGQVPILAKFLNKAKFPNKNKKTVVHIVSPCENPLMLPLLKVMHVWPTVFLGLQHEGFKPK